MATITKMVLTKEDKNLGKAGEEISITSWEQYQYFKKSGIAKLKDGEKEPEAPVKVEGTGQANTITTRAVQTPEKK